jgi:hypothetical protein
LTRHRSDGDSDLLDVHNLSRDRGSRLILISS